ncbi:GcrA family cell cycle regulator [Rhizobium wenxiniae]|uniref:GcrA family cell cycle regulator n=1 Tax=Rhizobium wenxiniae TaxID=1737357 RepID=UPI003C25D168
MTAATWTDERIERLTKLWGEGFSASQIAAQLGHVSRNAVIGKVHRLGLASRKTTTTAAAPRKHVPQSVHPARKSAPVRASRPIVQGNLAVLNEMEGAELAPTAKVMPIFPRVTLVELKPSSCKWPIGDPLSPEFRFCGAQTENGSPYCSYHACLAYQPRAVSNASAKTKRR